MIVTRKMLLIITASLGVLIIVYALVSYFFGIGIGAEWEKHVFDTIIIIALGCFMYNRKLAKDERAARAAAEEAERRAMENPEEPEEEYSPEEENLPHWERNKRTQDIDNTEE